MPDVVRAGRAGQVLGEAEVEAARVSGSMLQAALQSQTTPLCPCTRHLKLPQASQS